METQKIKFTSKNKVAYFALEIMLFLKCDFKIIFYFYWTKCLSVLYNLTDQILQ